MANERKVMAKEPRCNETMAKELRTEGAIVHLLLRIHNFGSVLLQPRIHDKGAMMQIWPLLSFIKSATYLDFVKHIIKNYFKSFLN